MSTQAIAGKFTTIEINGDLPPLGPDPSGWTQLAEVTDIGQIPLSRTLIDVSYHDVNIWPERIVGMANPTNIDLELNFIHEQYSFLNQLWDDEETRWFRVVIRPRWNMQIGESYWQILIEALITDVSVTAPIDAGVIANVSLAASGRVAYSEQLLSTPIPV